MAGLFRLGCSVGSHVGTGMPASLLRTSIVDGSPRSARCVSTGVMDEFGRVRSSGAQVPGLKSRQSGAAGAGPRGTETTPGAMPAHHQALQGIAEQLSGPLFSGLGALGGPMQAFRDRRNRVSKNNEQRRQEEVFEASREFLMEPERWTFGNMAAYQRKVLELVGATGWRRRISAEDPNILHLEKELKVLDAMTPVELASNHKSVFTTEAKSLIAEKSGTTVKFVEQVILEHDILRADRRWYQIRLQFGKQLPKTFEDRQFMGEYDRPFSECENEYQEEMFEKEKLKMRRTKPPRLQHIYFRQPTCGGNRWSTRPPRWYPAQWRMRPERRQRLAGVGVPGGGGDRGTPWGRLAK